MDKKNTLINLFLVFAIIMIKNAYVAGQDNKSVLQATMQKERSKLNLQESDVSEWKISSQNRDKNSGITHTYVQQLHNGIPVYNAISVFALKNDSVVYFKPGIEHNVKTKANTSKATIDAKAAVNAALQHLELVSPATPELIKQDESTHQYEYNLPALARTPIKVQLIYLPKNGKLLLAWDVSINLKNSSHWWNIRIDAVNGTFLNKNDYVREDNFNGNHPNNSELRPVKPKGTTTLQAAPETTASAGPVYNVFPFPFESPNSGSRSLLLDPSDALASPFGWHDTNGASGAEYTITRGNNVYAYEDQNNDDQPGYSPDGGAALNFDFPYTANQDPVTNMDASLTNLFYVINSIHDKLYKLGFAEADGNFEENNYGKGGQGNDPVLAEGFDGFGTNNANFASPPDGSSGRMQMFLWSGTDCSALNISSSGFNGLMMVLNAGFSPATSITADLILMDDGIDPVSDGCTTAVIDISGKIVLIDRGSCTFVQKVLDAQSAGAAGVIIINNVDGIFAMGGTGSVNIPAVMISQVDGSTLKTELLNGRVIADLITCNGPKSDGSFDNGIVAHEFGHGVSSRLTGGPANAGCLGNAEQAGEGWSDWLALMMTIKPGDQGTDARTIGSYLQAGGIRRYPYSTDMSINPQTYADLALSPEVHNIGEIWCSAVWDLSWLLINKYGYDADAENAGAGNNIAIKLILEGMKLQPCSPGFLDSRDAIFLADKILYNDAHRCLIGEAFARRGMGVLAKQGSADIAGDETADFTDTYCTDCAGVPDAGNAVTNTTEVCSTNNFSIALDGSSTYQGITYQWQISSDNSSWADISGATEATFTGQQSAANWYHCLVTCSKNNATSISGSVFIGFVTNCISMSDEIALTNCSSTYFDSGGPSGSYSSNENHTQTLIPETGQRIRLTWEYFNSEEGYDFITIYNGPDATFPVLYGPASGVLNIPPLSSSDPSGALTIQFTSDEAVTQAGWKALITCAPVCEGPVYTGDPNPVICQGNTVELSVTGPGPYSWTPAEGLNQTTGNTVLASPSTSTTYTVSSATDNECKAEIRITVLPSVTPTLLVSGPTAFCEGGSTTLSFGSTMSETPCTNDVYGQWPPDAVDIPCDDGNVYILTDEGYAGEYSVINVYEGQVYGFFSVDNSYNFNGDILTITDITGSTILATGRSIAQMMATFTGQVRFFTHEPDCTPNITNRLRLAACGSGAGLGFSWYPGGETTASITVNPNETTNYTLTLSNWYTGCEASASQLIVVNSKPVSGTITGPDMLCKNKSGYVYTLGGITNATTFTWSLPAGMSPVSGGLVTNTNSLIVKTSKNFNGGSISAHGSNTCGDGPTSNAFIVSKITSVPGKPTAINGLKKDELFGYCQGGTYTFTTTAARAETYLWTIIAGTILSGQGTNTINIQLNNSYSKCVLTVRAVNCMGLSQKREITLKPLLPKPEISGAESVCKNGNAIKTYSVSCESNPTSYTWSSPTSTLKFSDGGIATNPLTTVSDHVSVNFAGVGTGIHSIRTTADNACGSSMANIKNVAVKACTKAEETEISDNSGNEFSVFPNPAHDVVKISFNSANAIQYSITLTDMTGKVVVAEKNIATQGKNEYECHMESLSPGLYSIVLQLGDNIYSTRIIRQ